VRGIVVKATAVVMAVAGVVSLTACQSPEEKPAEKAAAAVAASLGRVEAVDWPATYEAGGVVRARPVAAVTRRVVATVTEERVKAGDRGQSVQVLGQHEARVRSAKATGAPARTRGRG